LLEHSSIHRFLANFERSVFTLNHLNSYTFFKIQGLHSISNLLFSLKDKEFSSTTCNSGPPLYQLKIFNSDSVQDNDLKKFCSNWLEVKRKDFELAKRIESDSLVESDLFSLKNYLKDLFILKVCSFKFVQTYC
jgi:hypothetical protein